MTVLKFATYGMLRLLIHLFPDASNYCSVVVQVIAIITLIFASLATILQQDTKTLIAYSSICHMAVVVLGIFSNTFIGIVGAILLGIAHGFVSPALFYSVGGVMYERYHKRNIGYYKGLSLTMPVFITMFFIFILANTGIPLTLNFLGEQLSLMGMWERNPIITVLGATSIVLSACYSIWMYNRIAYGSFSPYLAPMPDLSRKEFNLLIALLLPTVLFGIFPSIIIETLDVPTTTLLYITETPNSNFYNINFSTTQSITTDSATSIIDLNIKPNENDNQNTSVKKSLFLLFLKNLKNNSTSSTSFNLKGIFYSIITVLFLLLIMLWYLDIFNVLIFISELKKNIKMDYLKIVTLIIVIIPIIINSIMLYLLTARPRAGYKNYYTNILKQNKLANKLAFWVKFINSIINIVNKTELKNYYISTIRSELIIYLFILLIFYIFIY